MALECLSKPIAHTNNQKWYHPPIMTPGKYAARSADFALQEHSLLRAEITGLMAEARSLERNILIAVGSVWGFLQLHPPTAADRWARLAWCVPTLFVVLGGWRALAIEIAFKDYNKYLRDTEKLFSDGMGGFQGWETHEAASRRWLFLTGIGLWGVLFVVTILVAVYKYRF